MAPPAASLACACCGKEPEAGRKWACCARCSEKNLPSTYYCSSECQAQHWDDGGHKAWHADIARQRKEWKESGTPACDSAELLSTYPRDGKLDGSEHRQAGVLDLRFSHPFQGGELLLG